jgi:hypothetical protein
VVLVAAGGQLAGIGFFGWRVSQARQERETKPPNHDGMQTIVCQTQVAILIEIK